MSIYNKFKHFYYSWFKSDLWLKNEGNYKKYDVLELDYLPDVLVIAIIEDYIYLKYKEDNPPKIKRKIGTL